MSNKKDAASLLKRYLIARIPLIVLKTIETARALDMIRDVSLELVQEGWLDEKSFYAHTMSKCVYNLFTNQAVGNTGSSVLSAMDFTVKLPGSKAESDHGPYGSAGYQRRKRGFTAYTGPYIPGVGNVWYRHCLL